MTFAFWANYPFLTPIGQTDVFTGNGSANFFKLALNNSSTLAGLVQFDLIQYIKLVNGFSFPDSSHILTNTVPPNGSQGIGPAIQALTFSAFDSSSVAGVSGNANIIDIPFWLADDGNTIITNKYIPLPGQTGIPILFQNLVSAAGAQVSWTQLACANADGSIGTYQATGTTLYTDQISALTTLATLAASSGSSLNITVNNATGFYAGDYAYINPGGGTVESFKITAINYVTSTFTISGFNYNHAANENLFCLGRKFWARVTIPLGILNGSAATWYNLAINFATAVASRL